MGVKSFILKDDEFIKDGRFVNKFMPLERALNLLNTRSFWFANPETWIDPYEKRFICAKYDGNKEFAWKGRVFCTCFTNNATSEASWNAYSKDEPCIQMTFCRKELLKVLDDYSSSNAHNQVYFDRVEYMQSKNINRALSKIPFDPPVTPGSSINTMEFKTRLLLLKRKAFSYEEEFRAIIVKPKETKESGITVSIRDINSLICGITIGPKVRDDTFIMLRNLLVNQYGFNNKRVHHSDLYKTLPSDLIIKAK